MDCLRDRINDVDRRIVDLMAERLEIARAIGENKAENHRPIRDVEREEVVFQKYRKYAEEKGISPDVAESVCRILVKDSVDEQALHYPNCPEKKKIAIIGGAGRMGRWLDNLLSGDGHDTVIIDRDTEKTIQDCSESDVVIISTPIPTISSILSDLDKICKKDAVIFDIASIKSPFYKQLCSMSQNRHVCSLHPMFASSDRSMYDRNLIICNCGDSYSVESVKKLFDNKGANMITMDVEKHDMYMAHVLGMSHAINIAFFNSLTRSGFSYEELSAIASTTFRKSLDANKSVAFDDPHLYHDIQFLNENSESVWDTFYNCITELRDASLSKDESKFVEIMDKGRRYFSE